MPLNIPEYRKYISKRKDNCKYTWCPKCNVHFIFNDVLFECLCSTWSLLICVTVGHFFLLQLKICRRYEKEFVCKIRKEERKKIFNYHTNAKWTPKQPLFNIEVQKIRTSHRRLSGKCTYCNGKMMYALHDRLNMCVIKVKVEK